MTFDFSEDAKLIIDMKEYLNKVLSGLPDDMDGIATTPVADQVFKMRTA